MDLVSEIYEKMVSYYSGDPQQIQHFIKVHSFSRWIGKRENLSEQELLTLEIAALTHDIGIKPAKEKYGSSSGIFQEKEGPSAARALLDKLPVSGEMLKRILYLIGHHHTYDSIDGKDYQILVEADFLVNLFENQADRKSIEACLRSVFKTDSGKKLLTEMFLKD